MNEWTGIWANLILILVVVFAFSAMLSWIERRLLGLWQDRTGLTGWGRWGSANCCRFDQASYQGGLDTSLCR